MTMIQQILPVLQQATFQTMITLVAALLSCFSSIMVPATTIGNVLAKSPECWNTKIQLAHQL